MILLSIVLFLALIGVLCYHKTSLVFSSIIIGLYRGYGVINIWSYWMLLPVALVLFPFVFTPYVNLYCDENVPKSHAANVKYRKRSIDAGTTWWEVTFSVVLRLGINCITTQNTINRRRTGMDGPVETVCGMVMTSKLAMNLRIFLLKCGNRSPFLRYDHQKEYGGLSFLLMHSLKFYKNSLAYPVFLLSLLVFQIRTLANCYSIMGLTNKKQLFTGLSDG